MRLTNDSNQSHQQHIHMQLNITEPPQTNRSSSMSDIESLQSTESLQSPEPINPINPLPDLSVYKAIKLYHSAKAREKIENNQT